MGKFEVNIYGLHLYRCAKAVQKLFTRNIYSLQGSLYDGHTVSSAPKPDRFRVTDEIMQKSDKSVSMLLYHKDVELSKKCLRAWIDKENVF